MLDPRKQGLQEVSSYHSYADIHQDACILVYVVLHVYINYYLILTVLPINIALLSTHVPVTGLQYQPQCFRWGLWALPITWLWLARVKTNQFFFCIKGSLLPCLGYRNLESLYHLCEADRLGKTMTLPSHLRLRKGKIVLLALYQKRLSKEWLLFLSWCSFMEYFLFWLGRPLIHSPIS